MKDGVGLGFAGPWQLGCRKVRLLKARVAHAQGGRTSEKAGFTPQGLQISGGMRCPVAMALAL